jgi:type II secretory pathway component GspD/PulD (secretin)
MKNRASWLTLAIIGLVVLTSPPAATATDPSLLVTLQATDTSITEVLRILADRSGLNIVTSPEVATRTISIRLSNTPFEEALNLVVRAAGLGYERVGGTILVADLARLESRTGLVTRVYDLQHADPENVAKALEVITRNVSIDIEHHRVVIRATQSELEQAEHVITRLDARPRQVLLEARLIEVNVSRLEELGIDWEKITKLSTVVTEGYHGASTVGGMPTTVDYTELTDFHRLYRQDQTFEVAVDALLTDNHARLLSNAEIATLDGSVAEIFAGETVPVVITSLQSPGSAGGSLQSVQLEKIDVGVKLKITPRLTEDGMITVLVQPEVSRILKFVGPDADLPQTSTRRATTMVRVRDGQTIYLGGLLSEEKRETVKKVPLLGDIPLLGMLFRHTRNETTRYDLVIEITPRIVGDAGASLPTTATENARMAPVLEEIDSQEALETAGGELR